MMTSFYNLLKYAATGIASPSMTYYDKMRASTLMGGVVRTLTGIPPLSFSSDGTPLISWSMKGNGSQQGTPTPDNPVMPEFVGVRTGNLLNLPTQTIVKNGVTVSVSGSTITMSGASYGETSSADAVWESLSFTLPAGTYSLNRIESGHGVSRFVRANGAQILGATATTFTLAEETTCNIGFYIYRKADEVLTTDYMLNTGSTALPYEPFGYKIPITCAGQTTTVYLGQVSTVRKIRKLVLTGEENWQSTAVTGGLAFLHSPTSATKDSDSANVLSTHYKPQYRNNDGNIYITNHRIVIVDFSFDSVGSFKSFLQQQYAAGTPIVVWYALATEQTAIVNEPLCKIGDYSDELHSEDASVTIPTIKGSNTLTVDTELQPSEMTITFKG